jgi:phosphoribosylamine--glycine ligase
MAAQDYPQSPVLGAEISGLDKVTSKVFHAGTKENNGDIVVSGGRVLCVTATGDTLAQARAHVYADVERIKFNGEHHRSDIALQAANGEVVVP